jgi:hypothetical protein
MRLWFNRIKGSHLKALDADRDLFAAVDLRTRPNVTASGFRGPVGGAQPEAARSARLPASIGEVLSGLPLND